MHRVFATVDVDWAPDWAVESLLDFFLENDIYSTWFITHESPVLATLRSHPDQVELGIHPNFLEGSSHGKSIRDVFEFCMDMVPEARTMRTHCLMQSTPIFQGALDYTPIRIDTSGYQRHTPGVSLSELHLRSSEPLIRVPFVWEDDLEFYAPKPQWDAGEFLRSRVQTDVISVLDVHPIHYVLNSASVGPYSAFKELHKDVRNTSKRDAEEFMNRGLGAATFVHSLAAAKSDSRIDMSSGLGFLQTPSVLCDDMPEMVR